MKVLREEVSFLKEKVESLEKSYRKDKEEKTIHDLLKDMKETRENSEKYIEKIRKDNESIRHLLNE